MRVLRLTSINPATSIEQLRQIVEGLDPIAQSVVANVEKTDLDTASNRDG